MNFTVEHGLNCKKGGLVGIRHDNARDEWACLCSLAMNSSSVRTKPTIFYCNEQGTGRREANTNLGRSQSVKTNSNTGGDKAHGDVACHGFWNTGKTTIFDIRISDTDAKSYGNTSSHKILDRFARLKQDKYEPPCAERRKDFTALVYSVDELACGTARAAEKHLAGLLSAKWQRNYSEMVN